MIRKEEDRRNRERQKGPCQMVRILSVCLCVLSLPNVGAAADCVVSSVQRTRQYVTCTDLKGKVGEKAIVTIVARNTVRVAPGADTIAAALRQLPPSGVLTLVLTTGQYVGNPVIARVPIPITITADTALLPPTGARVTLAFEGRLPRLTPSQLDAPTLTIRGDHLLVRGVQIETPGVGMTTVELDAAAQPTDVTFDQVVIRGNAQTGGHRGIAANGINVTVRHSWCDRMWEVGRDSQCVAAWDTPGPLRIENNYLEASGENVLLGGATPSCGCITSDVTITGNTIEKAPAWHTQQPSPQVKNLFEIKAGRRVTVTGNTFRYNWQQAQTGWAILLTTNRDSGVGNAIEDVTFSHNVIRDVASGLSIAAVDGPVRRITVDSNLWQNLDSALWGGDGRFAMVQTGTAGVEDLTITHQTVVGAMGNQFLGLYGRVPLQRFVMTHNIVEQREYGIHSESGLAVDALTVMAPGAVFLNNAILGAQVYYIRWPMGNFPLDVSLSDQFDASWHPLAGSVLGMVQTSDGQRLGYLD